MEPDETPDFYTLFGKCGINMSYKCIYVHSSCLCRVPWEFTNTYRQCSFQFNLPLYIHIQMANHLLSVLHMIHKNQGVWVGGHTWKMTHPQAMDFLAQN